MKTIKKESRTYYRSIDNNGNLWCESKDPTEVIERSTGENTPEVGIKQYLSIDVITIEKVTKWKNWNPENI